MRETKCGFMDVAERTGQEALEFHGPTLLVDIGFDSNYEINNRIGTLAW